MILNKNNVFIDSLTSTF